MNIALKEAKETLFLLKLLIKTNELDIIDGENALNNCDEICRILSSIVKTTKNKSF